MRRKRPFFLLEIVIAIFLVGLFSVYFLRSSIHSLYRERNALLELEFERKYDIKRMQLLTACYSAIESVPSKTNATVISEPFQVALGGKSYTRNKNFKIYCAHQTNDNYDIVLEEEGNKKDERNKQYHFLVKKSAAKS